MDQNEDQTPVATIDAMIDDVLERPMMFGIDTAQSLDNVIQVLMILRSQFCPVERVKARRGWFEIYFERQTRATAAFGLLHERFDISPEFRFDSPDDPLWKQIVAFYAEWVAYERTLTAGVVTT